jgi:cyclophilin family peptidyl-prolyl cis-trans isomerase
MKENLSMVIGEDESGTYFTYADMYPEEAIEKYLNEGGIPMLDYGYSIFGQVIEGMDVVDKIAAVEVTGANAPDDGTPVEDVIIESIVITPYAGK